MPRLTQSLPKYRKHKISGQAVVTLDGHDVYLGPHGTAASRTEYDRVIAEYLAAGRRRLLPTTALTIDELVLAFARHAEDYYRKPVLNPDGTAKMDAAGKIVTEPTTELRNLKRALRPLRKLYGTTAAAEFGPLALKTVRQHMIDQCGWCRRSVNNNVNRVRQVFKWAVENELVPASVHHGLMAVTGLKRGRSEVAERDPVKPVPDEIVAATLPYLSRHVAAMVQLQDYTGMRPDEVCAMRPLHVDTTSEVWVYRPPHHKNIHHGKERVVYLGPRAQAVLRPFLKADLTTFVFSPADAEAERREQLHARRVTPLSCGNVPGSNRRRRPKRQPAERYSVTSYRRAIARACERAFQMPEGIKEPAAKAALEAEAALTSTERASRRAARNAARQAWRRVHCWHPHQLRHNAATRLRAAFDIEAAQVILGHSTLSTTLIYAEQNGAKARRIMAEVG